VTWVRLDDNIFDNPKIVDVSPVARLLHLAGICYSARHLTDGFIGGKVIDRVHLHAGSSPKHVAELVAARLWHEEPGGWFINDYLEYNPSKQAVLDQRSTRRAAGRAGGQASAAARAQANGQANSKHAGSTPDPSRPLTPISPEAEVVDIGKRRRFLPGSGWVEEA
jgi:hypothetical protein